MPKDLLDKWLAALRSGEYKQCRGMLAANGGYCCLGVLQHCTDGVVETLDGESELVPTSGWLSSKRVVFKKVAGYSGYVPYLPSLGISASTANDNGMPFAEIADAIEACAKGY
jgi:hypothetical protein